MTTLHTVILAVVEGLTEFLPVSSTGHLIIAQNLLGVAGPSALTKAFLVNIQFGAILSVVVLYGRRFFQTWDFYRKLLIAFVPSALAGLAFSAAIDRLLDNVFIVAVMLILGGLLMLKVDRWFSQAADGQAVDARRALFIGCFQCLALIPGVSRSMATIVGGMAAGLSRKDAAEFSFCLAVPTMAAACGYTTLKVLTDPELAPALADNVKLLLLGNAVAFLVALAAIHLFVGFLTWHGFKAFGYYRIALGLVILILLK